jgi:hypothetical protein
MTIPQLQAYRVTFSRVGHPDVKVYVWAINKDFAYYNARTAMAGSIFVGSMGAGVRIWRVPSPKLPRANRIERNSDYRARQAAAIRERAAADKLADPDNVIVNLP